MKFIGWLIVTAFFLVVGFLVYALLSEGLGIAICILAPMIGAGAVRGA